MNRVNVYHYDEETQTRVCIGHFDRDKAELFTEDTDGDGSNRISVNTRSQWDHQALYRTNGGRWVLNHYSDRQGSLPDHEYISEERARLWLLANNEDKAVEKHFGAIEEERGPGRPGKGPRAEVRLEPATLEQLDLQARVCGLTRADLIRVYVDAGLEASADKPTHIAAIGTARDVVQGEFCDLVVAEATAQPTFRGDEEFTEYAMSERVAFGPVDTSVHIGADHTGLFAEADEILTNNGYVRLSEWEYGDNAVYAEVRKAVSV